MRVRLVADDWYPVLNVSDVEDDDDGYEVPDELVARWRAAEKELDEAAKAIIAAVGLKSVREL